MSSNRVGRLGYEMIAPRPVIGEAAIPGTEWELDDPMHGSIVPRKYMLNSSRYSTHVPLCAKDLAVSATLLRPCVVLTRKAAMRHRFSGVKLESAPHA